MALRFFSEGLSFKLDHPRKTSSWLKKAIESEKGRAGNVNYIFCSDEYLHQINTKYLEHDDFTDIVTFDYSDGEAISGDIFISIDRVKDNATKFNQSFDRELHRVLIHGVLHLLGYKDKNPSDKAQMRKKEEAYLSLR
mgnify:CR=1 FL=1